MDICSIQTMDDLKNILYFSVLRRAEANPSTRTAAGSKLADTRSSATQNLANLHWLPVRARIKYKVACLTFKPLTLACLCGSLAQCALRLKRLSAGPGFNPQTRQNKLFQDYWPACFEINFSDRQEGLTVSSIICDR